MSGTDALTKDNLKEAVCEAIDRQGNEIKGLRVIGFQPADKSAATLDLVLR